MTSHALQGSEEERGAGLRFWVRVLPYSEEIQEQGVEEICKRGKRKTERKKTLIRVTTLGKVHGRSVSGGINLLNPSDLPVGQS